MSGPTNSSIPERVFMPRPVSIPYWIECPFLIVMKPASNNEDFFWFLLVHVSMRFQIYEFHHRFTRIDTPIVQRFNNCPMPSAFKGTTCRSKVQLVNCSLLIPQSLSLFVPSFKGSTMVQSVHVI